MSLAERLFTFTVSCFDTISDLVNGFGYINKVNKISRKSYVNKFPYQQAHESNTWTADAKLSFAWGILTIFTTWLPAIGFCVYFTKKELRPYIFLSFIFPAIVPAVW